MLANCPDSVVHVSGDEDVHAARELSQNVVRSASDEDAGVVRGSFSDGVGLDAEQILFREFAGIETFAPADEGNHVSECAEESILFVGVFEDLGTESAFFCGEIENFSVIVCDVQFFLQQSADGASAAAQRASDVDDKRFHFGGVWVGKMVFTLWNRDYCGCRFGFRIASFTKC